VRQTRKEARKENKEGAWKASKRSYLNRHGSPRRHSVLVAPISPAPPAPVVVAAAGRPAEDRDPALEVGHRAEGRNAARPSVVSPEFAYRRRDSVCPILCLALTVRPPSGFPGSSRQARKGLKEAELAAANHTKYRGFGGAE
jgi:hypothetical protein